MNAIQVRHVLPERIRLKMPAVSNERTARRLEKVAQDIDGIYWVRANCKCAGLVVRFDGSMFTESDIIDLLTMHANKGHA